MKRGLEWQVTSREWSQKLRELGVKQESYFAWLLQEEDGNDRTVIVDEPCLVVKGYSWDSDTYISAFTVAELGSLLPPRLQIDKYDNGKWSVYWLEANANEHQHNSHKESADTEADARAKMLIYLIENKLLKE